MDGSRDFDPVGEAAIHRLLASPVRLAILHELEAGECTAGDIALRVGLGQSPTSQHLARLREGHLVLTRKSAQVVHYRLAAGAHDPLAEMRHAAEWLCHVVSKQP